MKNGDKILQHSTELLQIEQRLSVLEPYSDDWFVWNEIRQEEERRLKQYIWMDRRLRKK